MKAPPAANPEFLARLREVVRARGPEFLEDPNVTSIGIGRRSEGGEPTGELCVQFTVRRKADSPDQLEGLGTKRLPKSLRVDGVDVPTDVVQRSYQPAWEIVSAEAKSPRKVRCPNLAPGLSVSHPTGTAGTLGAIVFDTKDGSPCMLSNWHVLHTPRGTLGDVIVQPGPFDDNDVDRNGAGVLVRSHLGTAGDCAIARIEGRGIDRSVVELNVPIAHLGRVEQGDRVVKSGRTTDVTYGIVKRTDVLSKIDYGGNVGEQMIGGFEIGPDPERPGPGGEISMGGDSGSAWLISDEDGKATDVMAGLHFAGEGADNPEEHALACYAHAVFQKLEIALEPPAVAEILEAAPEGWDETFLGERIELPRLASTATADALEVNGSTVVPYTHFSLTMSQDRRMARFVAWNVDGAHLRKLSRNGLKFEFDARIDEGDQVGDDAYVDNKLDRGHLARRADLCWGPIAEARRANRESFLFTNITPQHQAFNQSSRGGLWGQLEDAIFEDARVAKLRLSVLAGPIFKKRDVPHRGILVPSDFWKLLAYVDEDTEDLRAKAYIVTQDNLLDDIEALALDDFRLFQVSLRELEERVHLELPAVLRRADDFSAGRTPEALSSKGERKAVREVRSRAELLG
ncbi:MAG: DNA/RNA non-specific endonuclease [Myxococcota bacterium]